MRTFIDAYDASRTYGGGVGGGKTDAYRQLMAKKEAALAGWIAWVALQNPRHIALEPQHMRAAFGDWANRPFRIERRGESWALIG